MATSATIMIMLMAILWSSSCQSGVESSALSGKLFTPSQEESVGIKCAVTKV